MSLQLHYEFDDNMEGDSKLWIAKTMFAFCYNRFVDFTFSER